MRRDADTHTHSQAQRDSIAFPLSSRHASAHTYIHTHTASPYAHVCGCQSDNKPLKAARTSLVFFIDIFTASQTVMSSCELAI